MAGAWIFFAHCKAGTFMVPRHLTARPADGVSGQLKAMAIAVGYSFIVSFLIFKFINFILPLRVSSEDEEIGLDASQHNEKYLQGTLLVHNNGKMEEKESTSIGG